MDNSKVFETLYALDVNEHKEGKNGLSYLSWTWAWAEFKKRFSDATYEVVKDVATGLPYVYDANTGYMVYTRVTVGEVTHEMWLPVMDSNNKAMKSEPYTYKTKRGEVTVAAATMFDINKTIMRCLTKNLAMFGLGLYIYAGEDLPESDEPTQPAKESPKKAQQDSMSEAELRSKVMAYTRRHEFDKEKIDAICKAYKVEKLNDLTVQHCLHYINTLEKKGGNINE